MRYDRTPDSTKEEIFKLREEGVPVHEIAETLGMSQSGVYKVINQKKVLDLPIVDDSKTVNELRQRIAELEQENKNLLSDNRRLLTIIEKLVK